MIEWEWCHYEELSLDQLYEILAVRQSVFVVEQNCAYQDADGLDQVSHHLMGWFFDDEGRKTLAAYARIIPPEVVKPELAIGRVITDEAFRGQGLGRVLLAEAVRLSEETFPDNDIYLSAQAHLQSFYGSCDFVASGEPYDEDGIPHIAMFRRKYRQQPVSGTNLSQ